MQRKNAFVFDLDGTINHAAPLPQGLPIRGRTSNSFIDRRVIDLLLELAILTDLYVATGRSQTTVQDFKAHFKAVGLPIAGWILEHGTRAEGCPAWNKKVLAGIDLEDIHARAGCLIQEKGYGIDTEYYREVHQSILLYSGRDQDESESFLSRLSGTLNNRFRTITGSRKIVIIPKRGDKYAAFQTVFGETHSIICAAGDMPDDLTLLRHAAFPLTLRSASPLVQRYVEERGGFVAEQKGHEGTVAMLRAALDQLKKKRPMLSMLSMLPVPGPRLPVEEIECFRPSRRRLLDRLFQDTRFPEQEPDREALEQAGRQLHAGRGIIIEVRMRDWGGEAKSLCNLLKAMVLFIPYAHWRLVFRQERLGKENLKNFEAITSRLHDICALPEGGCRFSAPGVPQSPKERGASSITVLMYDHPDDMAPWYDYAVTRPVLRHPEDNGTWFVNPMFMKISSGDNLPDKNRELTSLQFAGPKVMMAANIVDDTDIQVAVQGFERLSETVDALIIAPRVVTNPQRNRKIKEATAHIGKKLSFLSQLTLTDRPQILFVDTYGDLAQLYAHCCITYLGGGFDTRKRGFDPMESLSAQVPVILGPIYNFNRIAVDSLKDTGWVHILEQEGRAVEDFVRLAQGLLKQKPPVHELQRMLQKRAWDPLRVAGELLGDLVATR
ncbi:Lipid IV(A) 3-deoxy-D-manno-octulosonic acid transferase [Candidatus Electrothrix aarhusensis]